MMKDKKTLNNEELEKVTGGTSCDPKERDPQREIVSLKDASALETPICGETHVTTAPDLPV